MRPASSTAAPHDAASSSGRRATASPLALSDDRRDDLFAAILTVLDQRVEPPRPSDEADRTREPAAAEPADSSAAEEDADRSADEEPSAAVVESSAPTAEAPASDAVATPAAESESGGSQRSGESVEGRDPVAARSAETKKTDAAGPDAGEAEPAKPTTDAETIAREPSADGEAEPGATRAAAEGSGDAVDAPPEQAARSADGKEARKQPAGADAAPAEASAAPATEPARRESSPATESESAAESTGDATDGSDAGDTAPRDDRRGTARYSRGDHRGTSAAAAPRDASPTPPSEPVAPQPTAAGETARPAEAPEPPSELASGPEPPGGESADRPKPATVPAAFTGSNAGASASTGSATAASSTAPASVGAVEASASSSGGRQGGPAAAEGQGQKASGDTPLRAADQARMLQRVTRAFQHVGPGGGTVRVRLHPPELGALQVEIRVAGRKMQAKLVAESDAARSAIRDSLPELRQRLGEQGIEVEQFDVEVGDHSGGEAGQGGWNDTRQQHAGSRPHSRIDTHRPQGERPLAAPADNPSPGGAPPGGLDLRF